MRTLLYISMMLLLPGCAATKKQLSTKEASSRDSTSVRTEQRSSESNSSSVSHHTADKAVGVPEKSVAKEFTQEDLQPVYTDKGVPVERQQTFAGTGANKGITGTLTVGADGKVKVECKADSFAMIIKGMDSTIIFIEKRNDSLSKVVEEKSHSDSSTSTKETVKQVSFWAIPEHWIAIILVVLGLVLWLYKKFR